MPFVAFKGDKLQAGSLVDLVSSHHEGALQEFQCIPSDEFLGSQLKPLECSYCIECQGDQS